MEESSTYQLLIERGKTQEARAILLRIGRNRFGEPNDAVESALAAASLEQLEQIVDRLLQAESWQELLMQ